MKEPKHAPNVLREPSGEYAHRGRSGIVSSKGQITIPKSVRKRYALEPGTEVEFDLREDGALLRRRRPPRHPAWRMIGSLRKNWRWPKGVPHTVDAYIDYIRGGSYAELTGQRPRSKKKK